MTEPVIVLDAGVIDLALTNKRFRSRIQRLVEEGWTPVIPTPVLAEVITGGPTDAPINQVIRKVGTTLTDEALARRAGTLRSVTARSGNRRSPSGVDAIVAAHAAEADRGVVFTTDPGDLRRLLADHPNIHVATP